MRAWEMLAFVRADNPFVRYRAEIYPTNPTALSDCEAAFGGYLLL